MKHIKLGIGAAVVLASMLSSAVFGAVTTLMVLAVLITLHEFGHWLVGRVFGITIPVFSVGFGTAASANRLFHFWGTEFQRRPFPLGGFVQLEPDSWRQASLLGRAAMLAAGPLMNLLIPVVLFFAFFTFQGVPVPGPVKDTFVAQLSETNTRAKEAGLRAGDIVLSVGGAKVESPEQAVRTITERKTQPTAISVRRGAETLAISVTPDENGKIGVVISAHFDYTTRDVSAFEGAKLAVATTARLVQQTLTGWARLLYHGEGLSQVQSIVGIIASGAQSVNSGILDGVYFAAAVSIALAIFNFLPLPGLDGGQLALLGLERMRGRPLGARCQRFLIQGAVVLLLALFAFALYNDLARILGQQPALFALSIAFIAATFFFLGRRG
jgi:regulator of sigma E protease